MRILVAETLMRCIIGTMVFLVITTGCSPWHAAYLDNLQGRSTDEVREKLGSPNRVQKESDGTEQWLFEVCDGTTYKGAARYNCEDYFLTFDQQKVLRRWSRKQ